MAGARDEKIISEFGAMLRRARTEVDLSQEQLAGKAGLNRTFIALLESGKRQPSPCVICALAQAVGKTPSALLDGLSQALGRLNDR